MSMKKILLLYILFLNVAIVMAKEPVDYQLWLNRIAGSEIKRNPQLLNNRQNWTTDQAIMTNAMMETYINTKDSIYLNYVKNYADAMIDSTGIIDGFDMKKHDLSHLAGGYALFDLYNATRNKAYLLAAVNLREQLFRQPRTNPDRVFTDNEPDWIGKLYWYVPFYTAFGAIYNVFPVFDDVTTQLLYTSYYTTDKNSGFNFTLWNDRAGDNKQQIESVSIGLYMMSVVDALDYLPFSFANRQKLLDILNSYCASAAKYQDKKTGLWYYHVTAKNEAGNFIDTSGSSMLIYAITKSVNKGYVSSKNYKCVEKAITGLLAKYVVNDGGDTYSLLNTSSTLPSELIKNHSSVNPVAKNQKMGIAALILALNEVAKY